MMTGSDPTVLVVGAAGKVAGLVVPELARPGVVVRGLVGRPVRAAEMSFDDWAAVTSTRFDARQLALFAAVFRSYTDHGLRGNGLVLETILGRKPRTLRDSVRDLAAGERTQV
jgi:hypothetical protein